MPSLKQLYQLVVTAVTQAITNTLGEFVQFGSVLVGEVEYLASYFGYNGPGSPAEQQAEQITEILTDVQALQVSLGVLGSDLAQLIGTPQQAGQPVTLPDNPPLGWSGAFAAGVWEQPLDPNARISGDLLILASREGVLNADYPGSTSVGSGLFRAVFNALLDEVTFFDPDDMFPIDFTLAEEGDTVASMLNAISPAGVTWVMQTPELALCTGTGDLFPAAVVELWCTFKQSDLETLIQAKAANRRPVPPIWPGLASVALGSAVALESASSLDGPMDGVLIQLDSVPGGRQQFQFDDAISYGHIGAIAFKDDNGDFELPQNLGFTNAVYCARSMARASSVKWRVFGGVTGTVTPWTVTA